MKNFEKYEKEILEIANRGEGMGLFNDKLISCDKVCCAHCDWSSCKNNSDYRTSCSARRTWWLYSEYVEKPKLNKQERKFCEVVGTGWMARDGDDVLYLCTLKPTRHNGWWGEGKKYIDMGTIALFNKDLTFSFIKWEDAEPWSIEELLKLEVGE